MLKKEVFAYKNYLSIVYLKLMIIIRLIQLLFQVSNALHQPVLIVRRVRIVLQTLNTKFFNLVQQIQLESIVE